MASRRKAFIRGKIANALWFVGLLLLLLVYWFVMSNFVIRDFWDPHYAFKAEILHRLVKSEPDRPLCILFGSSRVEYGFQAGLISDKSHEKDAPLFYNLGTPGADCFRQSICMRRVFEDGIKPRWVGIEIFGATMSSPLFGWTHDPIFVTHARHDELPIYRLYGLTDEACHDSWLRSRWDPFYKYGMKYPYQTRLWHLVPIPFFWSFEEKSTCDKWGWPHITEGMTSRSDYLHAFEGTKTLFATRFTDYKISRDSDGSLRTMLDLCKKSGAQPFLIWMPESKDFQALYPPDVNAIIDRYMAGIQREYGVPLIDARSWIGTSGFTDGMHLDGPGGSEFTLHLYDVLTGSGSAKGEPAIIK